MANPLSHRPPGDVAVGPEPGWLCSEGLSARLLGKGGVTNLCNSGFAEVVRRLARD